MALKLCFCVCVCCSAVPSAAPEDVAVDVVNNTLVKVSWARVHKDKLHGHLGGYRVIPQNTPLLFTLAFFFFLLKGALTPVPRPEYPPHPQPPPTFHPPTYNPPAPITPITPITSFTAQPPTLPWPQGKPFQLSASEPLDGRSVSP